MLVMIEPHDVKTHRTPASSPGPSVAMQLSANEQQDSQALEPVQVDARDDTSPVSRLEDRLGEQYVKDTYPDTQSL